MLYKKQCGHNVPFNEGKEIVKGAKYTIKILLKDEQPYRPQHTTIKSNINIYVYMYMYKYKTYKYVHAYIYTYIHSF